MSKLYLYNLEFSTVASYLPKNKNDDSKSLLDDPTSPYSINYSGEYNKNQGYAYTIKDKNGSHSVKFTSDPEMIEALKPPRSITGKNFKRHNSSMYKMK